MCCRRQNCQLNIVYSEFYKPFPGKAGGNENEGQGGCCKGVRRKCVSCHGYGPARKCDMTQSVDSKREGRRRKLSHFQVGKEGVDAWLAVCTDFMNVRGEAKGLNPSLRTPHVSQVPIRTARIPHRACPWSDSYRASARSPRFWAGCSPCLQHGRWLLIWSFSRRRVYASLPRNAHRL